MNKEALLQLINSSIEAYASSNASSEEISELRSELKSKTSRMHYAESELDLEKMRTERLRFILTSAVEMIKAKWFSEYLVKNENANNGWIDPKAKEIHDFLKNGTI